MIQKINNYYIKKSYTFLIAHGKENIVEQLLKQEPSVKIVECQAGSEMMVIENNGSK